MLSTTDVLPSALHKDRVYAVQHSAIMRICIGKLFTTTIVE